jgi:hypothetical protein
MSDNQTTATLIIDAKGLEKLVPLAASVGASVSSSLGQIDASTKMVEESLRQMTVEAKKDLAIVTASNRQMTAAVEADAAIRIASANAEGAERAQAARLMASTQIESERQVTALVREDAALRVQAQKQSDALQLSSHNSMLKQASAAQSAFTKMASADARQRLADSNNLARQTLDTSKNNARQTLANSNNTARQTLLTTRLTANATITQAKIVAGVNQTLLRQQGQQQASQSRLNLAIVNNAARQTIQTSKATTAIQIANINATSRAAQTAARQQMQNQRLQARQAGGGGGGGGGIGSSLMGMMGVGAGLNGWMQLGKMAIEFTKNMAEQAIAADKVATAYERQLVGARNLAGGQAQLNALLEAYEESAGGAIDKVTALQDVTKLMALGIANSVGEISQFTKAARGISIAMGTSVQEVTQDIALATGNLSTRRLDQLGLSIQEVNDRTEELRETNESWSREQAFGQAIIEIGIQKFGDLTESAQAQATGVEKMEKAWQNFGLIMSQIAKGPIDNVADALEDVLVKANEVAESLRKTQIENTPAPSVQGSLNFGTTGSEDLSTAKAIKASAERGIISFNERLERIKNGLDKSGKTVEEISSDMEHAKRRLQEANISIAVINATHMLATGNIPGGDPARPASSGVQGDRFTREQLDLIVEREDEMTRISNDAGNARLEETNQYERQRTNIIEQYEQQIAENAEDFARRRERDDEEFNRDIEKVMEDSNKRQIEAEQDLADTLDRMRRDAGRQQARWLRDFNKSIEDNNEDAAKRVGKENEDFAEDQAEAKKDSNDKIADLEADYEDDREKALRSHNDTIMEAAAHLDAWAIFNEQRRFAREEKEADKAHQKDIKDEQDALQAKLDEQRKGHEEQLDDIRTANEDRNQAEKEAYDQRVADANEALEQQIDDQIAAAAKEKDERDAQDAERLQDMKDAHKLRQDQEDTDRGIQLDRDFAHHNSQLTELDRVHGERITQIGNQEKKARDQYDAEFLKRMDQAGLHNAEWAAAQKKHEEESIASFDTFWKLIGKQFKDPTFGPKPEGDVGEAFNPYKGFLESYLGKLADDLANAQTPDEIKEINDLITRTNNALNSLNGTTTKASAMMVGGLSESAPWTGLDSSMSNLSNVMNSGYRAESSSVTMGDITIVLGDIGKRTDNDVKQLVGAAMLEWVNKAANYSSTSRW